MCISFLRLRPKMFEAEEDGAITEMELAVILKTALGVTHLSVSRLFTAIDAEDTGKITFGKTVESSIWLTYIFLGWILDLNFAPLISPLMWSSSFVSQATWVWSAASLQFIQFSRCLCLWRPLVVSPQINSGALWSSTQTLRRTTCTQKTQASTAAPATVTTKQRPACLPRTCTALPPPKRQTVSAPTSAPMTTAQRTGSSRNTTKRVSKRGWSKTDPSPGERMLCGRGNG